MTTNQNQTLRKIAVNLTVVVDAEGWELDYGTPAQDLRDDVRRYVADAILYSNTSIKGVTIK